MPDLDSIKSDPVDIEPAHTPNPSMHPDAYKARLKYLNDYEAWLADPHTNPPPDLDALLPHAARGSIASIEPGWRDGYPVVGVNFTGTVGTKPVLFSPGDFLSLDLGTAFGGGFQRTGNGGGLSYPKLRWSLPRDLNITVLRLLIDAKSGQKARQIAGADYHDLRRHNLWVERGLGHYGRRAFMEAVAAYFEVYQPGSGISTTLHAHLDAVRRGFELEDRREAARRALLAAAGRVAAE